MHADMEPGISQQISGAISGLELVPQKHGGALLKGGVPGHRGGTGRPPSEIRERLRGSLSDRVSVLEEIADRPREANVTCPECGSEVAVNPPANDGDRIRAIDTLAKYGLGTLKEVSVDQVQDRLRTTLAIIRDRLDEHVAEGLINELRGAWRE